LSAAKVKTDVIVGCGRECWRGAVASLGFRRVSLGCWSQAGWLAGMLRAQESLAVLLVASWLVGGNVSGSGASRAGAGRELVCGNV
jgi:hypothetical protein